MSDVLQVRDGPIIEWQQEEWAWLDYARRAHKVLGLLESTSLKPGPEGVFSH